MVEKSEDIELGTAAFKPEKSDQVFVAAEKKDLIGQAGFKFIDKQPISRWLRITGMTYLLLSVFNCIFGMYVFFALKE